MSKETDALLAGLAETLGTTVEHLWGVLLVQAPIDGAVSLICNLLLVLMLVGCASLTWYKIRQGDWQQDAAIGAVLGTGVLAVFTFLVVASSAQGIVAAFFNPEYWALMQLLGR